MGNFDDKSRSLLNFRPHIDFVEPPQEEGEIDPIEEAPGPQSIDIVQANERTKRLAEAVIALSDVAQSLIDEKAKDLRITLDPKVDAATIVALRRRFPDAPTQTEITYDQYRDSRNTLCLKGKEMGEKNMISPAEIAKAKDDIAKGKTPLSDPRTTNGGLRPELNPKSQVIEPIDLDKFQDLIIRLLVNFVWKMFIKPTIPLAGLPNKIAKIPDGFKDQILQQMNNGSGLIASPPMFETQDAYTIAKTYERGATYSISEAAVFAPMTRNMCAFKQTANSVRNNLIDDRPVQSSSALSAGGESPSLDTDQEENPEFGEKILDWLKECIPCKERVNWKTALEFKAKLGRLDDTLESWVDRYLKQAISQILAVINMFKNMDRYIDLCAFRKFFTESVCIPDLQRIIAVLMTLLMDIAFDLSSMMDLVMSLIAPLLFPFFSVLVNQLEKFLMMAVKPIECIIDSIVNTMGKLDYQVVFKNTQVYDVSLFGKKQGEGIKDGKDVKLKVSEIRLLDKFGISGAPDVTLQGTDTAKEPASRPYEFNLNPFTPIQQKKERKVVEAEQKVLDLKRANVDASNEKEYEKFREEEKRAAVEYRQAVKERDLSAVGRAQDQVYSTFQSLKGSLFEMVTLLKEAVQKFETFVIEMIGEVQKWFSQNINGSGNFFDLSHKKLVIVQLVAMIKAIIEAINNPPDCDPSEQDKAVEAMQNSKLSLESGFSIFTDENGDLNIIENESKLNDVLNTVVAAIGQQGQDGQQQGQQIEGSSQNLKDLINFTGDSVLDAEISKTITGLTTPVNVKFKCPLQTSIANADQVNQWITELA